MPHSLLPDLEAIVREAGEMAMRSQSDITFELKGDGTIVTDADRRVEEFLREKLAPLLPGATVNGEEFGIEPEGENGLWCIDPIDGTSNYAFGSPLWGVSVGLVRGEEASLGAVYLPVLGEMFLASQGGRVTVNGRAIPPIPPGPIRAWELVSYPDRIMRLYRGVELPGKMRHSGAFVVDATFTCLQRFRGLLGVREKLHDIAASLCMARELGADVRYADNQPLLLEPLKAKNARLERGWVVFPASSGHVF